MNMSCFLESQTTAALKQAEGGYLFESIDEAQEWATQRVWAYNHECSTWYSAAVLKQKLALLTNSTSGRCYKSTVCQKDHRVRSAFQYRGSHYLVIRYADKL